MILARIDITGARNMSNRRTSISQVMLVDDDALPPGHDWAALEVDGQPWVVLKSSAASDATVLDEARAGLARLVG